METKAKANGQAKGQDLKGGKTPQFVAGNPVNAVAKQTEEAKPQEHFRPDDTKAEPTAQPQEQPKPEPTKAEIREQLAQQKPAFNLEETLKLIADLAKKTELRDRYKGYIDDLKKFEGLQKDGIDELEDETAFQKCELTIRHLDKGYTFSIKSPSVITATVAFLSGRMTDRMAEVEAAIVLPA